VHFSTVPPVRPAGGGGSRWRIVWSEMRGPPADQEVLRRVATLVARQVSQDEVFAAVTRELADLLGAETRCTIFQYQADDSATAVAVGEGSPPEAGNAAAALSGNIGEVCARVLREWRSERAGDHPPPRDLPVAKAHRSDASPALGSPILVQDRLWGALVVVDPAPDRPLPDTGRRISPFAELVGIAIENVESRAEAERLFEEQSALRRVATLVAEGATPDKVFDAVVAEVAHLLGAAQVGLARYESEDITVVAIRGQDPAIVRAGVRLPLAGDNVSVRIRRTGRSERFDHRVAGAGALYEVVRANDISVTVGAPVFVDGALWGMIGASWKGTDLPPADAEERLAQFAQLVDTAIANADTRAKLTASRARVLSAGDEARRRVVRDLHDGSQQRLVHAIIALKLAQRAVDEDPERLKALLDEALSHAEQGNADLRELAHGILPSVLTRGGLRAGVDAIVSRLDLPVEVAVPATRFASAIESSGYFVVAEALTNVVKHARAESAKVVAALDGGTLRLEVHDDGIGGADPDGPGLTGISDRVAALGGALHIESPSTGGTILVAEIPVPA
jgi:signal transduction histidine kinase